MKPGALVMVAMAATMVLAGCRLRRTQVTPTGPSTYTVRAGGPGTVSWGSSTGAAYRSAAATCGGSYEVTSSRSWWRPGPHGPRRETSLAISCTPLTPPPVPPGVIPWGTRFYCTRHPDGGLPDVCTRSLADCQTFRGNQWLTHCALTVNASCFLIYPHKVERCSVSRAACEHYRAAEAARGTEVTTCVDAI